MATGSRLVRTVPATVVTATALRGQPAHVTGPAALGEADLRALTALRDERPVALVEHLDDRALNHLRFLRWLYVTSRCTS